MKTFNRVFTVIVFLFLYIPMIVLAVASFNAGTDIAVWKGFTFAQYGALFRDGVLLPLLANSVIVAVIASLVATVLGTMAAIGIRAMSGRMRRITMAVTNIPLTNPEIVTGVSLALLFAFVGTVLKKNHVMGFTTLLIAHRISTVERLDKIVFLNEGRVEAVGPHDQLYASCPEYRRMVDLQRLEDETKGGENA